MAPTSCAPATATTAGATTTSATMASAPATHSSPGVSTIAPAANVPSTDAASAIMPNHHSMLASTCTRVTHKVLGVVIKSNGSHIFRGHRMVLRQHTARYHGFDEPGFNLRLRHAGGMLDGAVHSVL